MEHGNNSITILIADDGENRLSIVQKLLAKIEGTSFALERASSYEKALEAMQRNHYDICMIDCSLSDSNGLDLLREAIAAGCTVPIILLSEEVDRHVEIEALRAGAADCLVKGQLDAHVLERSIRYSIARREIQEELFALSLMDDLTGLYNRRGFFALAQQQLKVAHRMEKEMHLLFIDLDDLKQINDNLGHHEGDLAIIGVAKILKNTFRESDILARIGGDEFVILTLETSRDSSHVLISRLQNSVDAYNSDRGNLHKLSISVGVATYAPQSPSSLEDLLERADRAMYMSKKKKR